MALLCQVFGTDVGDLVLLRGDVMERGLLFPGQLPNEEATQDHVLGPFAIGAGTCSVALLMR